MQSGSESIISWTCGRPHNITSSVLCTCVSFSNITCKTSWSFQKKQTSQHRTVKVEGGLILNVKDRYLGHPLDISNFYIYFQHFTRV